MMSRNYKNRMFHLRWVMFILTASMAFSSTVASSNDEIMYNVRTPSSTLSTSSSHHHQHRKAQGGYVSHSDESDYKTMELFFLDLFTTNVPKLNAFAQDNLSFAVNEFLMQQLNKKYYPADGAANPNLNPVIEIKTSILKTRKITKEEPGTRLRRSLAKSITGTEALIQTKVMFDREPAPSRDEVDEEVKRIMESEDNMEEFVDILQAIEKLHAHLKDVTEASRRELPTIGPTPAPVPGDFFNEALDPVETQDEPSSAFSFTYTMIAGGSLVALAAFLIFRKKRQSSVMSPKGDMLYMDVEGDLYSMDPSLESGPNPYHSPQSMSDTPSIESSQPSSLSNGGSSVSSRATSNNGGDSVFSGLESPRTASNIRSSKSLLSGFTNTSATTVQVSNANRLLTNPKKIEQKMPSYLLPGFAEDGEETDDETTEQHRPPRLTTTEDSEDSQGRNPATSPSDTSSNLEGVAIDHPPMTSDSNMLGKDWYGEEDVTSKDVLADLADFATTNGTSPRDPTPKNQTPGRDSPKVDHSMVSYGSIMGCSPVGMMCTPKEGQGNIPGQADAAANSDENLSTAKVAGMPHPRSPIEHSINDRKSLSPGGRKRGSTQTPTPRRSKSVSDMNSGGVRSVNSRMETPLQHNYGKSSVQKLAAATAGSASSKKSPGSRVIKLEWGNGVQAPGTVGAMSAKATKIFGGIYGTDGKVQVNGQNTGTDPEGTTSEGNKNPISPGGTRGRDVANLYGAANGDGNYAENLSRPTTPVEENGVEASDYAAQAYCMSPYSSMFGGKKQQQPQQQPQQQQLPVEATGSNDSDSPSKDAHRRRHAGNHNIQDGSAMYQTNAMHPLDWSYKSVDTNSVNDSTISESDEAGLPRVLIDKRSRLLEPKSPHSNASTISESKETRGTNGSSHSRQLIKDLVWLENKIARNNNNDPYSNALTRGTEPPGIDTVDSLSYKSNDNDGFASTPSSQEDSGEEPSILTGKNDSVMSSIVCRDVYAPPGKLHIVIHSTKDGPAVHTVKEGSSLEGHLFSGDLIISVDNVDTRAYTAEQVMKMMASRSTFERKITVLHFEEEE